MCLRFWVKLLKLKIQQMPHIVLLTTARPGDATFTAVLGGLAKAYRGFGHEVIVIGQRTPWCLGKPKMEEVSWGRIYRLGPTIFPSANSPIRAAMTLFQLLPLLRRVDFVHLHVRGDWHALLLAFWFACELCRVPIGVTFHGIDVHDFWLARGVREPFAGPDFYTFPYNPRWWERILFQIFLRRCRWMTAGSELIVNVMARALPSTAGRVRVVPHGYDPRELADASRRAVVSTAATARPFVLAIARQRVYKGIDVLLLAWKDVCGAVGEVELQICGSDQVGGHYQRLADELGLGSRVHFLGELPRPDVWKRLCSCLFFVLPARHEGFGIAALEAMACGKAVLATRSGGPGELIEDGVTGLLVAARDVEALRDGLLKLIRGASLRDELGQRARIHSLPYRWDAIAASYLALGNRRREDESGDLRSRQAAGPLHEPPGRAASTDKSVADD